MKPNPLCKKVVEGCSKMGRIRSGRYRLLVVGVGVLTAATHALGAIIPFVADPINSLNEHQPPANPCGTLMLPGTGVGVFNLDTISGRVIGKVVYSGFAAGTVETACHIHGPAAVCVSTGVIFPLPIGTPKNLNYGPLTLAQQNDMIAARHYINIHTNVNAAGQIRGQLVQLTGPVGACCNKNGTECLITDAPHCQAIGGTYQGDNTVCSPPEACCIPGPGATMTCVMLDPICCIDQGGIPQGAGTTCSPNLEACCVPGAAGGITCVMVDPLCCDELGGVLQPAGSVCSPAPHPGCCLPGGACVDVDPICCDELGGFVAPAPCAANPCPPPTGACCLSDGSCLILTQADCEFVFHGVYRGDGTTCAQVQCYKNWVIADDFCIACPNCRCDVNGDGVCDQGDRACVASCIVGPPICDCSRADLNCDGVVNAIDQGIVDCFVAGGVNCCQGPIGPAPLPINHVRWYGSYLDPAFDPSLPPPIRPIDGWVIGLHSDIPPVPCPNGATYDACGTIGGAGACLTFTPDGAAFSYSIGPAACCPAPIPPIPPIGSRVRICATFNTCAPCDPASIASICPMAFLPCDSVSRPDRLIAQWEFPAPVVPLQQTGKIGWDGHQIFCYDVNLIDGCLVHNFAPLIVFPDRFFPQPGVVYWISIQAEVGHQLCCPGCPPIPSPPIIQDFWGWHTTPPGYHNKDDAFMGMLAMGCFGEWIYNWMNHLHWSQPPYIQCADDPTASIDMAFYLINQQPGGVEQILWCQPINPGPPPPPPPSPPARRFPPAGVDDLVDTNGTFVANIFGFGAVTLNGDGSVVVRRDHPMPVGTTEVIDTEMLSLNLVGPDPFGGSFRISERAGLQSPGQAIGPAGDPYPADSFFDVFIRVEMPSAPPGLQDLVTQAPAKIQAQIHEVPPTGVIYTGNYQPGQVILFDANSGNARGELIQVQHRVNNRRGIDIHSDVDWRYSPMECTCEGDLNGDKRINGRDIALWISCLLNPTPGPLMCPCLCADIDLDGSVTMGDLPGFVGLLLAVPKPVCPL